MRKSTQAWAAVTALLLGVTALRGSGTLTFAGPINSEVKFYEVVSGDSWVDIANTLTGRSLTSCTGNTVAQTIAARNNATCSTSNLLARRLVTYLPADIVVTPTPTTTTVPPVTTVAPTTTTQPATTTTTAGPTTTTTAPPTTTTPPASGTVTETFSNGLGSMVFAQGRASTSDDGQTPATATVVNGALRISNGQQNYGDATVRLPVKYNLTNGGTVTLDISDNYASMPQTFQDSLSSAYIMFSANPQDGKLQHSLSVRSDPYGPNTPTEGTSVWLRDNCRVPHAAPVVVLYPSMSSREAGCSATPDGKLRLIYSGTTLVIQNGAGQTIVSYTGVTIPPTGYITLGVHNHATIKYSGVPTSVGLFDNVSYPSGGGTTSPPTTTTTPGPTTTTPAPTTTTPAPTTTQPPATGNNFLATFTNASDKNLFDYQLHTSTVPGEPVAGGGGVAPSFIGEHDMNCGDPTTHRTVTGGIGSKTFMDVSNSQLIWYCAPGNDTAKGHLMTALDIVDIGQLSFSPKQSFTNVTKVCWDQNMNNLGEGKWINVFIVPVSDVVAHGGNMNYEAETGRPFGGNDQFAPANSFQFTWIRGSTMAFQGLNQTMDYWKSYAPGGMVPDDYAGAGGVSAPRFKICLNSGGNMTIQRPDGSVDSRALGATFPSGPVKVIFQDASYNPTKHNGSVDHLTWHWDNIQIDVG